MDDERSTGQRERFRSRIDEMERRVERVWLVAGAAIALAVSIPISTALDNVLLALSFGGLNVGFGAVIARRHGG